MVAALIAVSLSLPGAALPAVTSNPSTTASRPIVGVYRDEQLAGIGSFTLPRTFLYDRNGELIPQEKWPVELRDLKQLAGDAFCCVSDTPAPPGSSGPPSDCKIVVYGTDVQENFKGLIDRSGRKIAYQALPRHRYLLVEYYATWCQPCVASRKAIETFFDTAGQADDYLWVSIDMSRLPEAQEAAKQAKQKGR